jgi:ParB family chromosome partitioning protein
MKEQKETIQQIQAKAVKVTQIPVQEIDDNHEFNCRGRIVPSDVEFLTKDISENGLLQPILVRPLIHKHFKYRIVAGFSRFLALRVLRWPMIPSVITDCSDEEAMFLNLSENIVRRNLNWLQEAYAVRMIQQRFPTRTAEFIAEKLGQSRGWVQLRTYVLDLPPECQEQIALGNVTQEQIRSIWQMKDRDKQLIAIRKIKEAKERGIKVKLVNKPKPDPTLALIQKRTKIFAMQTHIRKILGNNFATRCLGWAAGETSDFEIFGDIKVIADAEGKEYEIPKEPLQEEL